MKKRLVLITEIIAPYRIPLFNALARRGEVDLHVIFLAETDPSLRQWDVYREEIRFSYEILPSWRRKLGRINILLNAGVSHALDQARPGAILCGGYNYVASWQALIWGRRHAVPFFLWSESNLQDERAGHACIEVLKDEFLRACSGFVVPGLSARRYLLAKKVKESSVWTAPNAVDNDRFAYAADSAVQQALRLRRELDLPDRYFLFAGRLVREKGVFELLAAYAKLNSSLRDSMGLVFAGDGPARAELEQAAAKVLPGRIRFVGFAQRDQLAVYYALGEALVLPTYTDTWGLVVNEAMACGLPVIVSRAAGCVEDLVTDTWNGFVVERRDVESLRAALERVAREPELFRAMSSHSKMRIAEYSPDAWAQRIEEMMQTVGALHD